jgi:hypothetical protein
MGFAKVTGSPSWRKLHDVVQQLEQQPLHVRRLEGSSSIERAIDCASFTHFDFHRSRKPFSSKHAALVLINATFLG